MKNTHRLIGLLSFVFLAFAGCHELGHNGGSGGGGGWGWGGSSDVFRGRVLRNDGRYSSIAIATDDRREFVFYHNASTRVSYNNREYPVQNIQSGDYIAMRTRDSRPTNPMADTITVESLSKGPGGAARLDSLQGRVESIDGRRGTFEVRGTNNRIIFVAMPSRPSRADSDRFNRLRNGDDVRIRGRYVSGDRFELENFQ